MASSLPGFCLWAALLFLPPALANDGVPSPAPTRLKLDATLVPRAFRRRPHSPILFVSSYNITGEANLTLTLDPTSSSSSSSSTLSISLTARGSYPGQQGSGAGGGESLQPFNPLQNTRTGVTVYSKDQTPGPSAYSQLVQLSGSWKSSSSATEYVFQGITTLEDEVEDAASSALLDLAQFQPILALIVPPYPRLSDFVYVSSGPLT